LVALDLIQKKCPKSQNISNQGNLRIVRGIFRQCLTFSQSVKQMLGSRRNRMTAQLVRGIIWITVYFSALSAVLMYCSLRVARSNLALFKSRHELDMGERFDLYSASFFLVLAVIAGVSTWYFMADVLRRLF
jgi:hypothetical protein